MKKSLYMVLLILALVAFSACKREDRPAFGDTPVVDVSKEEEIKIGVISSGNSEDGNALVLSHLQGVEAMRLALGLSEEQIDVKTDVDKSSSAEIREATESCADDGCKIIFGTEPEYASVMAKCAEKYPDIVFSVALSDRNNGANLNGYTVKMYPAQYLSGIVAGYNTNANLVGYVAYEGDPYARAELNAFAMGVARVNPAAFVYIKTVDSRFNSEAERKAAKELLNGGCDVIGQNTLSAAPQLAAEAAGCRGCGYAVDMTAFAPKGHLQAPVVNWGLYYTRAVKNVIEGTWDNENYTGGIGDGFANLSPVNHNCKRGTTAAVNEAREELMAGGEIFSGPIENDMGKIVCPEGSVISDADIPTDMDWHYWNIIELESDENDEAA